jgi:hypothetical protein
MTTKEMAKEIRGKYEGVPEMQVSAGIYIHTIGRKYVTLLNTWETTRFVKVEIEEFYNNFIAD